MRAKIILICALLLLALASSAAQAAVKPQQTVLIYGDSLSAAFGLQPEQGWPALAAKELQTRKISVINASVSGETTAGGLARLPAVLQRVQPQVLVLILGANDGLRGLDPAAMAANLSAMVRLAKRKKIKVLLIGIRIPPNFGPEYTQAFEQSFVDVAKAEQVAFLKFLLEPIAQNLREFQADQLHPIASAQPKIWAHVRQALLPVLSP
jgi:acyl-CoA thioesterase I